MRALRELEDGKAVGPSWKSIMREMRQSLFMWLLQVIPGASMPRAALLGGWRELLVPVQRTA